MYFRNINRNIIIAGGEKEVENGENVIYDHILEFKTDEDAILTLGRHMTQNRSFHAISVVQIQDYSNWCQ